MRVHIEYDGFNDSIADTFDVSEGRFTIVMVYECGKQSGRDYTAKAVKKAEAGYEVELYKRKIPSYRLVSNEELAFISYTDVVRALPVPTEDKRSCFKYMIYFKCSLDEYQLQ